MPRAQPKQTRGRSTKRVQGIADSASAGCIQIAVTRDYVNFGGHGQRHFARVEGIQTRDN